MSRSLRVGLAGLGFALFATLVWKVGPPKLFEGMRRLGWGLPAIIAVGGLSHVVKTWAWRFTFSLEHRTVPFFRLLGIRLAGEATALLSVAGQVLGEATRALLVRSAVPMTNGISSVVLDRAMYTFTALLLVVLGALLALLKLRLPEKVQASYAAITLALIGLILLGERIVRKRWPLLSVTFRALGRIRPIRSHIQSKQTDLQEIETIILSFYGQARGAFRLSLALNLVGHALAILEVYLVLWFLGAKATLLTAFLIEALTKVVNIAGVLIPGNVGAYEGGNVLILRALGLGSATGLTLGIARRLRGLFWAAVGWVVLFVLGSSAKHVTPVAEIE